MKKNVLILLVLVMVAFQGKAMAERGNAKKDTTVTLLSFGLIKMNNRAAYDAAASRFGIRYYNYGCVVTEGLIDSIRMENNKAYAILEKRYGANWQKQLDKEVKTMTKKMDKAKALVEQQAPIKEQVKALAEKGREPQYEIVPEGKSRSLFTVRVGGWEAVGEEGKYVVYYSYAVNVDKGTATPALLQ